MYVRIYVATVMHKCINFNIYVHHWHFFPAYSKLSLLLHIVIVCVHINAFISTDINNDIGAPLFGMD